MNEATVTAALINADKKLKDLGALGIIDLMLSRPQVPVDGYIASHMAVLEEPNSDHDYSEKRRQDVYVFDDPATDETKYFKITCWFDSWNEYEWVVSTVDEVELVEKTIRVWEEVN